MKLIIYLQTHSKENKKGEKSERYSEKKRDGILGYFINIFYV